jgi:centromeric protein E
LLTLGSVTATLAEKASQVKEGLMLQPSLSSDARISVICTLNPDIRTSTQLFAQRIKKVQPAKKKEVGDTDALLEWYRQAIEELKKSPCREGKEAEAPEKGRRSPHAR